LRVSKRTLAAAGALATVLVGVVAWQATMGNLTGFTIREVLPGRVLRSSQPTPTDLQEAARRYRVRSVLNLRGPRPSARWYQAELDECRNLGLEHRDVRIKLEDWPPQHEVVELVRAIDAVEKPVLLHCRNGTDRSGWGAAVVLALEGLPFATVMAELSPAKGHVCVPSRCPLHKFFARYEAWLDGERLQHSAANFRRWATEAYVPGPYGAQLELLRGLPARPLAAGEAIRLEVRVSNLSPEPWILSSAAHRGIRLGVRCLGPYADTPTDPVTIFRRRAGGARDLARAGMEDGEIAAGASRNLEVSIPVPAQAGRYLLQLDMVDEGVHWFSDLGGPGIIVPFEVSTGAGRGPSLPTST